MCAREISLLDGVTRKESDMSWYKATTSPSGWTNNTKVRCSGCGATLYVRAEDVKKHSGWECPHCGKRH